MSHLVSPNAYRLGRTRLWGNVRSSLLESVLWRNQLSYPIGLVDRASFGGAKTYYLLYYPIFKVYRYRNRFIYPRFYRHLKFLSWVRPFILGKSEGYLLSVWARALYRFNNRFTIRRRRIDWRDWFKVAMMRGVGRQVGRPISISSGEWAIAGQRHQSPIQAPEFLTKILRVGSVLFSGYFGTVYRTLRRKKRRPFWVRYYSYSCKKLPALIASLVYALKTVNPAWLIALRAEIIAGRKELEASQSSDLKPAKHNRFEEVTLKSLLGSKYSMSNALLSHIFSHELRSSVRVVAMNVFHYMLFKQIVTPKTYAAHLDYLMNRRTTRDQHYYSTYFDLLNVLFLQSRFSNIEWVLLRVIKYTLFKMHKRNIKLKYFLRFVHNAIQAMGQANREFSVFRLMVHGKIKGGTHRTKTFTAGYGKPPVNTVGFSMKYCFDNIYSKYGEYGMHLIVGRRFMISEK